GLPLHLPGPRYPTRVASTLQHELQLVQGCFGGSGLVFIEPDGTVWDCPSRYRIAAIRHGSGPASISGTTAQALFPHADAPSPCDCPLYSGDCVNMWPLVEDFDRFLTLHDSAADHGPA
ncbi:MAG: hypothetical protein H7Y15_07555, partial [Pseudonocardia sp.]|nr:hypothetical protein [Pseudonocardia sp.]